MPDNRGLLQAIDPRAMLQETLMCHRNQCLTRWRDLYAALSVVSSWDPGIGSQVRQGEQGNF